MGHRIWRQAFTYRNEDECLDSALGTQMITTEAGRDNYDGNVPLCSFEYGCVLSSLFFFFFTSLISSLFCHELTDQMQWNITLN